MNDYSLVEIEKGVMLCRNLSMKIECTFKQKDYQNTHQHRDLNDPKLDPLTFESLKSDMADWLTQHHSLTIY